jgi:hypothetical protein
MAQHGSNWQATAPATFCTVLRLLTALLLLFSGRIHGAAASTVPQAQKADVAPPISGARGGKYLCTQDWVAAGYDVSFKWGPGQNVSTCVAACDEVPMCHYFVLVDEDCYLKTSFGSGPHGWNGKQDGATMCLRIAAGMRCVRSATLHAAPAKLTTWPTR